MSKKLTSTLCGTAASVLAMSPMPAPANETNLSPQETYEVALPFAGSVFKVTGSFKHSRVACSTTVTGAREPGIFAEEIYGNRFAASVSKLPAGTYQVEVHIAETFHTSPGERLMTVTLGGTVLAERLDVFAAAGGQARAYVLKGSFQHPGDAVGGPLTVGIKSDENYAILNGILVFDAEGKEVARLLAKDLEDPTLGPAKIVPVVTEPAIYGDPDRPVQERVRDLVRRMSLAEKVAQMHNDAPGIPRLGVPAYDYWNEALHGVARAGVATVFPQAIGLAATWDPALVQRAADAIATEGRAKYNDAISKGHHDRYFGLTYWTPNINIFRDPRWGRGQETYGEDPLLTSRIGVAFIRGLQGDDPRYYKSLACAKHFAVHSGPEADRHHFDVRPTETDLWDTYLPQFEAAVREGRVGCVTGAYNRVNGESACASPFLLEEVLRRRWGFQGYVVSDCGGINDIHEGHRIVKTEREAAVLAVKAGCDLECGNNYSSLVGAVQAGLITETELDTALARVLTGRFRLGMFDSPERVPYASIPLSENDSPAHDALALRCAQDSLVLLKNQGSLLPLDPARVRRIAVVGPNADSQAVLLSNYHGQPSHPVTILQGIRDAAGTGIEIVYAAGCPLATRPGEGYGQESPGYREAVQAADSADVVVLVGGLDATLESEEMKVDYAGFSNGDRTGIELPACQDRLLAALQATGKPVIFVLCSGGAVAIPWAAENVPAILQAWYPGQRGGTAVADALFGKVTPAGRLPVTFYKATTDLPDFTDYSMANRTYRYFTGAPLFAFGHGLSYTTFRYGAAKAAQTGTAVRLTIQIENTGGRDGDEVVQVYARRPGAHYPKPLRTLVAFQRVHLKHGEAQETEIEVPVERLRLWNISTHGYQVEGGEYEFQVGASSQDMRASATLRIDG